MKILTLLTASLLVVGCGSGNSEKDREETVGAEIASGYNEQMQRARDVEVQLQDHTRDLEAAIEQQTDPDR